ncbi:PAS domain-containing protein, partial [Pseudomonas viridiflava]|uniref:PAS domain-containing protein n=1 Tax=Pseudomonas viridiflava TaxID=33069 RepID=UPI0013DFABFF
KGLTDGYEIEYRIRRADNLWLWVEDRGRAVERDAEGRVTRMLGTRRDITAWKSRDEEQRLAAIVFEAASEGIIILDPDYKVLAVNQAHSDVT